MEKGLYNKMCAEYNLGINTLYSIIEGHTNLSVSNLTKAENHLRHGHKLAKQFFGIEILEVRKIKDQVKIIIKGFAPVGSFIKPSYKILNLEDSKSQMKVLDELFEGDMSLNDYSLFDAACEYRKKL